MRAALTIAILLFALPAAAENEPCNTGEVACAGEASFGPVPEQWSCYMVYHAAGGYTGFCLRPDETRRLTVRSGDSYCGVFGSDPPALDCPRRWLTVE